MFIYIFSASLHAIFVPADLNIQYDDDVE